MSDFAVGRGGAATVAACVLLLVVMLLARAADTGPGARRLARVSAGLVLPISAAAAAVIILRFAELSFA